MARVWIILSLLVLGSASLAYASTNTLSEQQKIAYLLDAVGTSKLIFVRNSVEYPGTEAKELLQTKLKASGNTIQTADDFINNLASYSSTTGKPYYIEFPDGTMIESKIWLRARLAD